MRDFTMAGSSDKGVSKRAGGSSRVTEGRYEQVDPHLFIADRRPALAEIDLQLPPRRRLEAHRRQRLRRELTPQVRHRPLGRPQADNNCVMGNDWYQTNEHLVRADGSSS